MKWRWQRWIWILSLWPPLSLGGINTTWLVELGVVGGVGWLIWKDKESRWNWLRYKTSWWFLGWGVIVSLSAIKVVYWVSFGKMWWKWLAGLAWLWLMDWGYRKPSDLKEVINSFFIVGWIKVGLEAGLYSRTVKDLELKLLASSLVSSIRANWLRGRTIISFFNEPMIVAGWWWWLKSKHWKRWLGWLLIVSSGVVVFMSNWRGRMIVWLMAVFGGGLGLGKRKVKRWFVGVVIVGIMLLALDRLMLVNRGYSVIDRLLNKDRIEDKGTLSWRAKAFQEAGEMASYSLFGVGMGQFYNLTSLKGRLNFETVHLDDASKYGPHNLFFQFLAETGWLGWGWLVLGLSWFGWLDISRWQRYNQEMKGVSLVFWLTVGVTQFYPAISWEFVGLFFGLRGLLMKWAEANDGEIG